KYMDDVTMRAALLDEEQERELEQEQEQEREIERPAARTPQVHKLHPKLKELVEVGCSSKQVKNKGRGGEGGRFLYRITRVFRYSSLANYPASLLDWSRWLFITKDFLRTVKRDSGERYEPLDEYFRPPNCCLVLWNNQPSDHRRTPGAVI